MEVDFRQLDYSDTPSLVLKNLDGTPIQIIRCATDISLELMYNEVSTLSFSIPAYVDNKKTPHYDDIVGMRIINVNGIGQFLLVNPKITNNGVSEIKSCKAYSLEFELTFKKIFIEEGTYNFWNPVDVGDTVIGRIMELLPSWSIGEIDDSLIGKYRTFSVSDQSIYDFIKGTVQETFQCIFEFDTYSRKITVRSVNANVSTAPVYVSLHNLIKEINIEEDTENIFTCLDVNGAEGVDIRSVNPTGTNKIYNLDYFMTPSNFSASMISKWESWCQTYKNYQQPYFDLTVEKVLQESKLETQRASLMTMQGKLQEYETLQSTYVEASAQGIDQDEQLASIKEQILNQKTLIEECETSISNIEAEIASLLISQQQINKSCSFESFFTDDELKILDRYFKEDAISEDSFVYREVESYSDEDISKLNINVSISISNAKITKVRNAANTKDIYSIQGGKLVASVDGESLSCDLIRGALERKNSGEYVFSGYLNAGSYSGKTFTGGCITGIGSTSSVSSDVTQVSEIGSNYLEGTSLTLSDGASQVYITKNATEYSKRSVEWDLFEYGTAVLEELAWPQYTFSIDSSNFYADSEFQSFKNSFRLGDKLYLDLSNGQVLEPFAIGVSLDLYDRSKLSLIFSDSYSAKDNNFQLVDLLEESISMGKTVSSNKFNYNSFIDSGASTSVRDFMNAALDVAKNAVMSSSGQAIQWDGAGVRLRKHIDGSKDFEPEQIWMINNSIVFTDDNWSSAKMAIGKFEDQNLGTVWGVVAPSIVGTLLAGSNLIIESAKQDGGVAVFKVDADGAKLYNSIFDIVDDKGSGNISYISLLPSLGIVGGKSTSSKPLFQTDAFGNRIGIMYTDGTSSDTISNLSASHLPIPAFWIDLNGNAYFNGTVYATDGQFTGTVYATDGQFKGTVYATDGEFKGAIYASSGEFSGTLKATTLNGTLTGGTNGEIRGVSLDIGNGDFIVDNSGNVTMNGRINLSGGTITWGSNDPTLDIEIPDLPSYIKSTYISSTEIRSPEITGNNISVYGAFQTLNPSGITTGFMGAAYGMDAAGNRTYGVALSSDYNDALNLGSTYVIVTNAGVRMQGPGHQITITANGIYADGQGIQTGSATAVFG